MSRRAWFREGHVWRHRWAADSTRKLHDAEKQNCLHDCFRCVFGVSGLPLDKVLLSNSVGWIDLHIILNVQRRQQLEETGLEDSDLDSWDYIVKVDDDCTLRIDKLVEALDTKSSNGIYMGALENPAGSVCTILNDVMASVQKTDIVSREFFVCLFCVILPVSCSVGFYAIRNKKSKWYLPYSVWPKGSPHFKYIGGWCYVLSRDVAQYCADRMLFRNVSSEFPPGLWKNLPWEDAAIGVVLIHLRNFYTLICLQILGRHWWQIVSILIDKISGLVASEMGAKPHHSPKFKSAWESCSSNFIAKHHDAGNDTGKPDLIVLTHEQILANPTGKIHCNPDTFTEGSYKSWRDLRNKGRS